MGALALGLSGCGGEKEEKPTPSASASFSPSDCPTPGENGAVPVPPSDEKLAEYCDQLQNQTEVPETELDKYIPRDMQQYYNMPYSTYINEPTDETYGFMKSIVKTDQPIHEYIYKEIGGQNYIPYKEPGLDNNGQEIMDGMVYLFQESLLQWDRTVKTGYKTEKGFILDPTSVDFNSDMATKVMPYMFHYTDSEDIVKAYDEGEFYYTFNSYAKDQNTKTAETIDTWTNTDGGPWKYEVQNTSELQDGTDVYGNTIRYKDIKAIAPTGENVIVRAYWEKTADGKGDHWSIGQAIVDQDSLPELPTK